VIAATAAVEAFYSATGSIPQNVNWAVKGDYVRLMVDEVSDQPPSESRGDAIARVKKAICQVEAMF